MSLREKYTFREHLITNCQMTCEDQYVIFLTIFRLCFQLTEDDEEQRKIENVCKKHKCRLSNLSEMFEEIANEVLKRRVCLQLSDNNVQWFGEVRKNLAPICVKFNEENQTFQNLSPSNTEGI